MNTQHPPRLEPFYRTITARPPEPLWPAPAASRAELWKPRCLVGVAAVALASLLPVRPAAAQSVVSVGPASYASSVPAAVAQSDAYYGLPADQVTGSNGILPLLHLDPSKLKKPLPSNHWWTDLMVASGKFNRPDGANEYNLTQSPFGGVQWVTPYRLDPRSYGFSLYYMNSWLPANANNSQATINSGQDGSLPLQIHGNRHTSVPSGDILVADFESGYPAGWTVSPGSNAFGTIPTQKAWSGHNMTGFIDNGLVDTYLPANNQGGNAYQGTLSGSITIQKHYLHFLVGGGNDPQRTLVRLKDTNGNVIYSTTGADPSNQANPTGPTETMHWVRWDVSAYQGKAMTFEIVDASSDGWGFIMCDEIVQSDATDPNGRYGNDIYIDDSMVTNWGDWSVDLQLQNTAASRAINVTMARGIPFVWTDWVNGVTPKIAVPAGTMLTNLGGGTISTAGGSFTSSAFAFTYQGHPYGIFLPDNTTVLVDADGSLEPQIAGANNYMVIGCLPDIGHLAEFNNYAFARPTNTQLSWQPYDSKSGLVSTNWTITTTPLKGGNTSTLQGWIPHHYRTTTGLPALSSYSYPTARGLMYCTPGTSFTINFPFNGIVPILPAPTSTSGANPYQPSIMQAYLQNFDPGTMIGDTYWSGKALALCAQYMAWAKQTGDDADFNRLKTALENAFTNWFTYTPGEENSNQPAFFTYYPDWGAFIGFNASYGSQAFNDLHFHYGYFTTAASTLAMYDPAFVARYKPMLTLIAKSYANYDRTDTSEPFLRMFDAWEGHSNAGGLSNPTDGENQESSSEAMQGWAGLFLLGGMTSDGQMMSGGAAGYAMEAAATQEYWEDAYQTNFPSVYHRGYAGQVYGGSYAYATFFSADPAWVYAIQWGPSNHWLNYLTRNAPTINGQNSILTKYNQMWQERTDWMNSQPAWDSTATYQHNQWYSNWVHYKNKIYASSTVQRDASGNPVKDANGNQIPANTQPGQPAPDVNPNDWQQVADMTKSEPDMLGDSPGHVVHAFQALLDPDTAAAEFDNYVANKETIVDLHSQAGSTYYLIHSIRQAGQQDFTCTTDMPISSVYKNPKTGQYNYLAYNPSTQQQNVTVYQNGQSVGAFAVPAQTLIDSHLDQTLTTIVVAAANAATVVQPGQTVQFTATGYDQYKATCATPNLTWSVNTGGTIDASGKFTAAADAYPVTVTAASGGKSATYTLRVGPAPVLSSIALTPGFVRVPVNATQQYTATGLDQYGSTFTLGSVTWSASGNAGTISASGLFTGNTQGAAYLTATSGSVSSTTLVAVHAPAANVALHRPATSSNDYGTNVAANLTDGDNSTRWESPHGVDNQFVSVDLGAIYDLSSVSINWEGAYAATYTVDASVDGNTWTTLSSQQKNSAAADTLPVSGVARYVRLSLLTRGTAYGFSIWEWQVYGYLNAASVTPATVLLTPTNVTTLVNAQPTFFQAAAFDANYEGGLATAAWTVAGGGTINAGSGKFTPTTAGGPFAVTATYRGVSGTTNVTVNTPPTSASAPTNVALNQAATASSSENSGTPPSAAVDGNPNTRWSSAATDNEWITVDLGAAVPLSQVVLVWENAYGSKYLIRGSNDGTTWTTLAAQAQGAGGTETLNVSGSYRYVQMQGVQRATQYGYSLYEFRVMSSYPPKRANKALRAAVTASSQENAGTQASNAVDGDTTTRWSSVAGNDNDWITVDLGTATAISQVVLNWENAYGSKYLIRGSNDGTTWTTLYTQANGAGGVETLNVAGAYRYVQMYGQQRATTYGYSLWELQVY